MADYSMIPPLTKDAIDGYVAHRYVPGSFVFAVLSNDLKNAVSRADDENARVLIDIVRYCYWEIPGPCWGSKERVLAWLSGEVTP